ncbi:MAG TPA: potassium channel protein [Vicinamibacterales bacterium]|nr:potassium channel protein [Vicinamibacterales bacterium]
MRKTPAALSWLQGPGLGVVLFLVVCVVGTVGYSAIEGWSLWDSAFMTIVTVSTVGYEYVHPLSRAGEAWTAFVLLAGVSTLFYTAFVLMALVVDGGLHRGFEQRRFKRMLDQLTNHFIICGFGRIGSTIFEEFRRQGVPCVVIDRDPEKVHGIIASGGLAVEADASREEVLKRVGLDRARGLIAAVSTDAENVYTVLTARVLRPDLFIIARVESDEAESRLKRAGADRVISPYTLGAIQMAHTALRPAVVDFMRLATSNEHMDLSAEQIELADHGTLVGKSIREAELRQRYGVIVVAIRRKEGHMEFNPSPEARLHGGDQLVLLGSAEKLRLLDAEARPPELSGGRA